MLPQLEFPQSLSGLAGGLAALWDRNSHGWVGVDFGTSSIKLAQLERAGDGWRLKHSLFLPLPAAEPETLEPSAEEVARLALAELTQASGLGSVFSNCHAAAVASLGSLELQTIAVSEPTETDGFGEPAAIDLESGFREAASWELPAALFGPASGRQSMLASMETAVVTQLAEGVALLGLDLCTIDVLPVCIARSLSLCGDFAPSTPVAMLDLGHRHPSLTVCQEGMPVYCRRLKHCGLESVLNRLAADLGLSPEESRALLTNYGTCPAAETSEHGPRSVLTAPIQDYLRGLKAEIIRTLDYLESHRRVSFPEELILCGGGAALAGIDQWLANQIGIPALLWSPRGPTDGEPSVRGRLDPLFAVAASLSLLAWEA